MKKVVVCVVSADVFKAKKYLFEGRRKCAQMTSCFDVKQGSFNNKTKVLLHSAEASSILAP